MGFEFQSFVSDYALVVNGQMTAVAINGAESGLLCVCALLSDHGITASRHHGITASQRRGITASRHHSATASRHHSITASLQAPCAPWIVCCFTS